MVVSYQGRPVSDASAFRNEVAVTAVGKKAEVVLLRKGKREAFSVTIEGLSSSTKMLATSARERLGVEVRPTDRSESEKYNLSSGQGVAIVWVDPQGPLGQAGFEPEDIILEINGDAVKGLSDFLDKVSVLKPRHRVTLLALDHRSGQTGYVQVLSR